jgi:hypothetical protein
MHVRRFGGLFETAEMIHGQQDSELVLGRTVVKQYGHPLRNGTYGTEGK